MRVITLKQMEGVADLTLPNADVVPAYIKVTADGVVSLEFRAEDFAEFLVRSSLSRTLDVLYITTSPRGDVGV